MINKFEYNDILSDIIRRNKKKLTSRSSLCAASTSAMVLCILFGVGAPVANAQQKAEEIEEVVVTGGRSFLSESDSTAQKLTTPIAETAAGITVYESDFLDDLAVGSLSEAVDYVPGVTAYSSGHSGSYFFVARGFGVSSRNGIRVNGAPIGDDFFFDDVAWDRMEYVKGAQSAAYGEVSAGGFVNIAMKEAADDFVGNVQLSFDSFNNLQSEITVGGPLTSSGNVRGLVAYSQANGQEFYDGGNTGSEAIYGNLVVDFSDRLTGKFYAYHEEASSLINSGLPLGEDLTDPLNPVYSVVSYDEDFFASGDFSNQATRLSFAQATLEFQIMDSLSLHGIYSVIEGKQTREDMEPAAFAYGDYVDLTPGSLTFGDVGLDVFSTDRDVETNYGEIRLQGDTDIGPNATMDFYVSAEYYKFDRVFTDWAVDDSGVGTFNVFQRVGLANPFPSKQLDGFFAQDSEITSLSAVASLDLFERLRLNLGYRYDDRKARENYMDPSAIEVYDNSFTSKNASIVYDLTENLHAFYAYGEGFEYLTTTTCDGSTLDPEQNESHELGIKWELADSVILSVTGFDNKSTNSPVNVICPAGSMFTFALENGTGEQFGKGVEIEAMGNITDAWNISVGYSNIDDGNDYGGGPVSFVTPKETLTLYTIYDFLEGPLKGFGLGMGLRHGKNRPIEGDVVVPVHLADVLGFDPEVDPGRTIDFNDSHDLGSYTVFDVSAYYRVNDNADLALNIRNVTDEEWYSSGGDPYFKHIRQMPRQVMVTVDYKF